MTKILKLDHFGRGLFYDKDKITFVFNALPNEDIEYQIIKRTKKYNLAKVTKINEKSPQRIAAVCPYFNSCGGCALLHLKYEDTLKYKKEKIKEIFKKYAKVETDVKVIANPKPLNYRNKLSLKIKNKQIGFYEENTHDLIAIDYCFLAKEAINALIKDIKYFNLINADIIIRCNYNDELLIIIKTKDKINIDLDYLKKRHKIAGIVINDQTFYNDNKFMDKIDNKLFQISYNSFFQVNPYVTHKLFEILKENIPSNSIVADLFCGVGSLSIISSLKAKKVYGIEIVKNAILNALVNQKINQQTNLDFCLGDANKLVFKLQDKIDTIIVDPPRSGLTKEGINSILNIKPQNIIYISCDPMTLARDLNILKQDYQITKTYIADMFSYTYHIETICILKIN